MLHIVKKANQLKNCIAANFFIVSGISLMLLIISDNIFPKLQSIVFSNFFVFSGGYSSVLKTVYNIDDKKTKLPIEKATFTDIGTIPASDSLLTPSSETNHGKLLAIQVPIPIINV